MPTDPTSEDARIAEHIRTLVGGLPAPVRDYVTSDALNQDVLWFGRKYQLHTDQMGMFRQEMMFLLLGVHPPVRFANVLEDQGFAEEMVEGMLADLNERVFAPLRKAEREWSMEEKKRAPAPTPVRASSPPLVPPPAPIAPPVKPVVPTVPVPPAAATTPPTPAPTQTAPTITSITTPPVYEATMRTMAHDIEGMKDGHAPAPVPHHIPDMPVAPTPALVPPPIPAPVAPSAPATSLHAPDPVEVKQTLQKYGIDPYREAPE